MKSLIHRLGGFASNWLLARPSTREVGQANLRIAFAICGIVAVASVGFVVAQWITFERLYNLQSERDSERNTYVSAAQEMVLSQTNAHRFLLNALLARNDAEFNDAKKQMEENLQHYAALKLAGKEFTGSFRDLKADSMEYREQALQILALFNSGSTAEALELRITKLRPIFVKWQTKQEQFAQDVNRIELRDRSEYMRTITGGRIVLLVLLLAPGLIIFGGLLAIVAVIGWQHWGGKSSDPLDVWAR